MIGRYCSAQMRRVWDEGHMFALWADVEVRVLRAQADAGVIPAVWADRADDTPAPTVERVAGMELVHRHQMVAFLDAWGPKHMHIGVASSDVQDLALWTQISESSDLVGQAVHWVDDAVGRLVRRAQGLTTAARTHGQAAQDTEWAHLPVDHLVGLRRAWARLVAATEELAANAKLRGATGNYAPPAVTPEIEQAVLEELGFTPTDSATQIAPRDVVSVWANTAVGLAQAARRVAVQIRLDVQSGVQAATLRPVGEGSSSMPHKTNPALAEQVCGLSAVVAGLASSLDGVAATWGHRDLTNSSVERVVLPQIAAYTEHLLLALATALDQVVPLGNVSPVSDSAGRLTGAAVQGLGYFEARSAVRRGYDVDNPAKVDWLGPLLGRLDLDVRDRRADKEGRGEDDN